MLKEDSFTMFFTMSTSAVGQSDLVIYLHTFFFSILFHYGLSQDTEYDCKYIRLLLFIHVVVCIYQP